VFQEKLGLTPAFEGNEYTYWGNALEPVIANRYAEEEGVELVECETLVHPEHNYALATPDRAIVGQPTLVEIKCSGMRRSNDWGEPGSDKVPPHYLIQCQWQMLVASALAPQPIEDVHLAALFSGNRYEVYIIKADPELQSYLLSMAGKFWNQHVVTGEPPPIDGSERSTAWLNEYWEQHDDEIAEAPEEAIVWAEQLKAARNGEDVNKAARREAENHLKDIIGDRAGIVGPWGKATWKKPKPGSKTDWEAVAKESGATQEIINKHTVIKEANRRFLVRFDAR
jgi:putative phage-type endonuclease